mmetsp:Transcript_90186/g.206247  ORF Transcript_90186/g.206247 Transcript_90186/m.206247 type:complete len:83 (-) Transcript_90186:227-475(-)
MVVCCQCEWDWAVTSVAAFVGIASCVKVCPFSVQDTCMECSSQCSAEVNPGRLVRMSAGQRFRDGGGSAAVIRPLESSDVIW